MPKRKKRAGRKRVEGVVREPNGRASRKQKHVDERERETQRQVRATVVEARMRQHDLKEEAAAKDLAGYALGRLRLGKEISEPELEAGNRFALDAARYYRLTGVPFPSPRSASIGGAAGRSLHEPDREAVQSAAGRWMGLQGCIGIYDRPGKPVLETLMNVCVRDMETDSWPPHMLGYLHKGLRALVDFYGIEAQDVDSKAEAA